MFAPFECNRTESQEIAFGQVYHHQRENWGKRGDFAGRQKCAMYCVTFASDETAIWLYFWAIKMGRNVVRKIIIDQNF